MAPQAGSTWVSLRTPFPDVHRTLPNPWNLCLRIVAAWTSTSAEISLTRSLPPIIFPVGCISSRSLLSELPESCKQGLVNMSSKQCVINPSALPSSVTMLLEPCKHGPGRRCWAIMGKQMSLLSMSWNLLPELMFQWICLLPAAG